MDGHRGGLNVLSDRVQVNDEKAKPGFGSSPLLFCVVLVMYLLSSGPAMWFHARMTSATAKRVWQTVYAPVVFLINKTPLGGVGSWWVYKWVDVPESRAWLPPPP